MTATRGLGGKADDMRIKAAFKTGDDIMESTASRTGKGCYPCFTDENH